MGKTTKKVSWRTLSRQAAALEAKNGKPTAASKRLRKMAAAQRKLERSKKRTATAPKPRRPAKKATPARNKIVAGLKEAVKHVMAHEGPLLGAAHGREGAAAATDNVPLTYTQEEHHEAIFKAVEGAVHRANDNIVCSFIAMYRYGGGHHGPHAPWKVEAETMRALIDVLDRAGYTATGRQKFETAPVAKSENEKAS